MKNLLCIALALLCSGCMMMEGKSTDAGQGPENILIPHPIGDWIIPLSVYPEYTFHYTELDTNGRKLPPYPGLSLSITNRGDSIYGWDYESDQQGDLLIFIGDRGDSSGIYTIGKFMGDYDTLTDTTLLLPQWPERIGTWITGWGTTMSYLTYDTSYFTQALYTDDYQSRGNEIDFQKHPAYLLEETLGDTTSYYYFRKGIGMLGFERSIGGNTVAVGTLFQLIRNDL